MKRCLACETFVDVHLVDDLAWCASCLKDGVQADYVNRVDPFQVAAVDGEILRRVNDAKIGTAG